MTKARININAIQGAAIAAFQEAALLAHREMIVVISEPGAFDGFEGDIVDTGTLRAFQQPPEFSDGGRVATFRNTVEYALYVHEGYTLRNGGEVEGRPWMRKALERFDFEGTFNKLLELKLR